MGKNIFQFITTGLILFLTISTAQALPLEVNSGTFAWIGSAGFEGGGRGQGFHANSDFSVSSIGIFGDLKSESFDIVIYASTNGSDTGAVLANASGLTGGIGNAWNDIAIDFLFNAGNYYIVNWRPSDRGDSDWVNTIDYYHDFSLPVTTGPLTLLDGLEGTDAEHPGNLIHPNMRYDVSTPVPEPATMLLFGTGIAGLAAVGRRKKS